MHSTSVNGSQNGVPGLVARPGCCASLLNVVSRVASVGVRLLERVGFLFLGAVLRKDRVTGLQLDPRITSGLSFYEKFSVLSAFSRIPASQRKCIGEYGLLLGMQNMNGNERVCMIEQIAAIPLDEQAGKVRSARLLITPQMNCSERLAWIKLAPCAYYLEQGGNVNIIDLFLSVTEGMDSSYKLQIMKQIEATPAAERTEWLRNVRLLMTSEMTAAEKMTLIDFVHRIVADQRSVVTAQALRLIPHYMNWAARYSVLFAVNSVVSAIRGSVIDAVRDRISPGETDGSLIAQTIWSVVNEMGDSFLRDASMG